MNGKMIRVLVRKDLGLVMAPALTYTIGGVLALGMIAVPGEGFFYAGVVLLVTALMALGFHPAIATSVGERRGQTLAFVMSMPVTPADYTVAKLLVNLLVFFVPWTAMLLGCAGLIRWLPSLADGVLPLATILFGVIAASSVVILCVAMVSESVPLTIATQVAANLVFQGVMYAAAHHPAIEATMRSETVVWSAPALAYCGAEAAIALAALAATIWLQARKTTFI